MSDIAEKNLKEILKGQSNPKINHLKKGLYLLKPSKKRSVMLIVIYCLLLYTSMGIMKNDSSQEIVKMIISDSSGIILNLFSIVVTGYALFQALINITALKMLLRNKGNKNSLLEEYNLYFLEVGTLYIIIICINYLIKVVLLSEVLNRICNECLMQIGAIGISGYCILIIYGISEILSFLFNLYKCFNISSATTFIENRNKDNNIC